MRVVAIDYGEKRIGVAAGDTGVGIAFPVGVLASEVEAVAKCIREQSAERVLVGMPYRLSGEESRRSAQVQQFIQELQSRVDVPVEHLDERMTTKEAERRLIEADYSRQKRRQVQDALAATLLLETYFSRQKSSEAAYGVDDC